ncbi:MAG TPA: PAS domain-containing protein [Verrucomicrobiae bacterium]|nr:PAS domain-containing protein [Verrucomicrobiae bacterium]
MQLVDLLDFAIEQANDGIAIMRFTEDRDVPIRIVYANRTIERLSGYSRQELLDPSNPFLQVQPQNRARYEELFVEIRAGRSVRFEIELGGRDRSTWTEIRWSPLRYHDGEVTHYVAVLRDISELRRRSLFQSILSETSDFIVTADASRPSEGGPRITYANRAFAALVGLDADDVVGRTLVEFFSPRNDRTLFANVLSRLERHSDISYELLLTQAGGDRWIELSGHQVHGEGGRIVSWFFIGKDISLRKQAYMQTAQLMTALDLADEPIVIYNVIGPLELELQHMNTSATEFDAPLIEKMLGVPAQRIRIEAAWNALEKCESVRRLVRTPPNDPRRWVTLEIRPMHSGKGNASSIIAIEHGLRLAPHDRRSDDIATMLALSREIRSYPDVEARRDALAEVLREEWGATAVFSATRRGEDVVLRAMERSGYAVMPQGLLFDRSVAVDFSWPGTIAPRRLTALRILLETLARAD